MAGFTVKLEVFYNVWKTVQDWILGLIPNKPKVDVSGTVEVSNLPTTQQVAGEVQVTNLPEVQKVEADQPLPVSLYGTFVRLSTEPKPSGREGDSLLLYDTKQVFIHDGTDWREW